MCATVVEANVEESRVGWELGDCRGRGAEQGFDVAATHVEAVATWAVHGAEVASSRQCRREVAGGDRATTVLPRTRGQAGPATNFLFSKIS
jgi:hypothetical protein